MIPHNADNCLPNTWHHISQHFNIHITTNLTSLNQVPYAVLWWVTSFMKMDTSKWKEHKHWVQIRLGNYILFSGA